MVKVINSLGIDITSGLEFMLDRQDCRRAFKQLLLLWPAEVDVSSQEILDEKTYLVPELSSAFSRLEDLLADGDKNIGGARTAKCWPIVNYAIFKTLHRKANGSEIVRLRDLTFEEVEKSLLVDYLGWRGFEPLGVTANSVVTVDQETGKILAVRDS